MAKKAKNMVFYIIKRILLMIPMLLLVLIVTFIISQSLVEKAVISRMTGGFAPTEILEAERERLGLDQPLIVRLGTYLANIFTGNWGESYSISQGKPVLEIIAQIFPRTIELVIIPTTIIPIIAVKLGVISAKNRNKTLDNAIRGFSILGRGFPVFFFAIALQLFFGFFIRNFTYGEIYLDILNQNSSTYMGYYPAPEGAFRTNFRIIDSILYNDQLFLWDTLLHLILPATCMTIVSLSAITRQTRSSMLEVMQKDYIRTARVKGTPEKDVLNKHALRNALIPTSNLIVGGIARRLTGSLLIEICFNYIGFGYFMIKSIRTGDLAVLNGLLIFSTIIILSSILLTDILYVVIDPRITYK